MDKKKRVAVIILFSVMLITAIVLGSIKLYRVKRTRESGILLAFDDASMDNWRQHFEFFEKYNVHVTFFLSIDGKPNDFCFEAMERGHDIGFHTTDHSDVTKLSKEEIQKKVIDPIENFRKEGIELTSFAYPYGSHTSELDEELLKYYKIVRGAYYYDLHSKADLRHGFIDAFPIDNHYLAKDEDYKARIDEILKELSDNVGAVACLYSHSIDGGDWCVTEEHLEYLFQKADELGLKFYTFRELQEE